MKGKKWVLVRHFDGFPKDGDLEIQEEEVSELQDGDVLLEGVTWTVDPYMRLTAGGLNLGDCMMGTQLARIIKSRNKDYPVGKLLMCEAGWRTHTVLNPSTVAPGAYLGYSVPYVFTPPDTGDLNKSHTVGALGMPGATAYFGFLNMCKPKAGETVLVNGAAGAVGSLVGQIAKLKGCKVIGFAGTEAKVKHLKDLGFDLAYNYKKVDVSDALKEGAPEGIDCYYDNVGGDFTTKVVMNHMNRYGRIAICGAISTYHDNPEKPILAPLVYTTVLVKELQITGLIVFRWVDQFQEAWAQMAQWIREGKIKASEHVTDGFENMFAAFQGLFKGDNIGKAVINATSKDQSVTRM